MKSLIIPLKIQQDIYSFLSIFSFTTLDFFRFFISFFPARNSQYEIMTKELKAGWKELLQKSKRNEIIEYKTNYDLFKVPNNFRLLH